MDIGISSRVQQRDPARRTFPAYFGDSENHVASGW